MEHLKRLAAIWQLLATYTHLSRYVSEKDIASFHRRVEGEGVHFLTTVLPRLFKALDSAMQSGTLAPIVGFRSRKGCVYPLFLSGAWEAIFNEDGSLKHISSVHSDAVACIRQLSAIFYKLELPYTEDQIEDVITAFIKADDDLARLDLLSKPDVDSFLQRVRAIVCRLLAGVDPTDIRPKHGSGASSCRVKPARRYSSFRYIPRLDKVFPYAEYFFSGANGLCDNLDLLLRSEECEPAARVVLVPKDSRGPRLISCEPRELMYIQQGLMSKLYDTVQAHPAIRRQIGFTDQRRNQKLAMLGSLDSSYATLDLKEASDRVSWELVCTIFPKNWVRALNASRSTQTMLPDGTFVSLNKFAPMGSACCFPVEAICFWAIALAAIGDSKYNSKLFRNRLAKTDMQISVFGDDIIVPTQHVESVVGALTKCGLLVNTSKSYWAGHFRESCGGDFHNGVNVTPIRAKALPTDDKRGRHRMCDLFNNIIAQYGYERIGLPCQELYESWYGPVVVTSRYNLTTYLGKTTCSLEHSGAALIGRYTDVPPSIRSRFNRHLWRYEAMLSVEQPVYDNIDLDCWSQVLRRDLQGLSESTASRYALARRVRYKYSWVGL